MAAGIEDAARDEDGSGGCGNDAGQKAACRPLDNLTLNTHKAGMQGLDADKINEIIQKASEGSRFYQHKQRAQQKLDGKIADMVATAQTFSEQQLQRATRQMQQAAEQCSGERDLSRMIVHVDMDMFYAAVEMRDDTNLRNIPMAVGSPGMLSTSNYAARKYGVRAAMPGFIAQRLCPQLVIVPVNFSKYRAVSAEVEKVFALYDPNFVMMSLDEAYLDITEYLEANREAYEAGRPGGEQAGDTLQEAEQDAAADSVGKADQGAGGGASGVTDPESRTTEKETVRGICQDSMKAVDESVVTAREQEVTGESATLAEVVVREMRGRIKDATGLTASAGIACNTRLAKVCSDLNKPNGQYYLPPDTDAVMDFVRTLPIRKIGGIGNVMEQHLKALGISVCGDVAARYALLKLLFSGTCHTYFLNISLGLGETDLSNMSSGERKSISTETTFSGTSDRRQLFDVISELCEDLHRQMAAKCLLGRLITVKTKTADFVLKTRSLGLGEPTRDVDVLKSASRKLLTAEMERCVSARGGGGGGEKTALCLRLLGVRMSSLCDDSDEGRKGKKQTTLSQLFAAAGGHSSSGVGGGELNDDSLGGLDSATHDAEANSNDCINGLTDEAADGISGRLVHGTQYVCPVCEKQVQTKFLSVFNKHIDSCLENYSEDSVDNDCPTLEASKYTSNGILNKSNQPTIKSSNNLDIKPLSTNEDGGCSSDSLPWDVATRKEKNDPPSTSSSSSPLELVPDAGASCTEVSSTDSPGGGSSSQLLCPVCGVASFLGHLALNRHLDECLAAIALSDEPLDEGSTSTLVGCKGVTSRDKIGSNFKRKHTNDRSNHKKAKVMSNHTITKYFT